VDRRADTQPSSQPAIEPRQRWRFVFRRDLDAPTLSQRDLAAALDAALVESGLPLIHGDGRRRSPIAFGAPLPSRMTVEHELADLYLADRVPIHEVRPRLVMALPPGFQLIDLYDVWVGEAPLAAQVVAADYRIVLGEGHPGGDALAAAARRLLVAPSLLRDRPKGAGLVQYDLRPLLIGIEIADPGPPVCLLVRTRFHNELGTGRPEEVVAALGDVLQHPLQVASIVRERVVLRREL
jgi:radical SAM-linked protein